MRYTSPQITSIRNATNAVQSVGFPDNKKPPVATPDSPDPLPICTPGAYEADE